MKLINPSQISGEIMSLIDEADKFLVIVSPYYKISKWYKLLKKIEALKDRKINTTFYVRTGEIDSIAELVNIGFHPKEIKGLHCKIYFNEKEAIISSMNLLLSSDTSSLDIALKTTNEEEYQSILNFYKRYISKEFEEYNKIINETKILEGNIIHNIRTIVTKQKGYHVGGIRDIFFAEDSLIVTAHYSTYRFIIKKINDNNHLFCITQLTQHESENIESNIKQFFKDIDMDFSWENNSTGLSVFQGIFRQKVDSSNLQDLQVNEKDLIVKTVLTFIGCSEAYIDIINSNDNEVYSQRVALMRYSPYSS